MGWLLPQDTSSSESLSALPVVAFSKNQSPTKLSSLLVERRFGGQVANN